MPVTGLALALFAGVFLLHLVRWRLAPPAATTRALLVTFGLGIPGGLALILLAAWLSPGLAAMLPAAPFGLLQALLLALALAAGYVMTYPAIEVESPTLVMIQAIARRGEVGLPRETLFAQLNDKVLVAPRVRDLLRDGLAVEQADRLHLSAAGRRMLRLFVLWRQVLGAREGG